MDAFYCMYIVFNKVGLKKILKVHLRQNITFLIKIIPRLTQYNDNDCIIW